MHLQPHCLSAPNACCAAVAVGTTRDLDAHPLEPIKSVTLLTYTTTTTSHAVRELADAASVTNRQQLRPPTLNTHRQPICFVADLHPQTPSCLGRSTPVGTKARPTRPPGQQGVHKLHLLQRTRHTTASPLLVLLGSCHRCRHLLLQHSCLRGVQGCCWPACCFCLQVSCVAAQRVERAVGSNTPRRAPGA